MQHKCTVCSKVYDATSDNILNGCSCGNKLFYYINEKKANKKDNNDVEYFYELEDDENQEIIAFDLESVNILEHGVYEIDIKALMDNQGLVYRYGEGQYSIDLDQSISRIKHKK